MTKPTTTAATIAATVVAAIATVAIASARHEQQTSTAAPRIYGGDAPTAASTPAPPPAPTPSDAEDLTRRWTTAFDRASACVNDTQDLRTIVHLATGELAQQLAEQPPRPGAQADCHVQKIVDVTSAGPPKADGRWIVFVEHKGATGGPFTVTLLPTEHGLRVAALDY